jgi:cytochrome c553
MLKFLLFLFLAHISFELCAQELIETSGFVESFNKKSVGASEIKIRTPKEDIILNFDKLDKETQKRLSSEEAKKSKQLIKFNQSAVIKKSPPAMGVRADCSEMPTDMKELENIATNSNDMLDFLNKIPEGSLQGFTFVTNSLSLHRGKKDTNGEGQVSPMWPRVLRTSMDGKITVSFVCDPKNPTFGKVEIIHFDDKEKEFKTTEFDFGHPNGQKVAPLDRVHKNPESCISCHAGSEVNGKTVIKPNWPEYFQWSDCKDDRGIQMYGGNDDNMGPGVIRKNSSKKFVGCDPLINADSTYKEQTNYQKFRELQKNNACFNSLPWADESKNDPKSVESNWTYKYYPYSKTSLQRGYDPENPKDTEGILNYSLRTNLRMTSVYSHLMSTQIAGILKKNPDYDTIKYFLLMEQARCQVPGDQIQQLNEIMPNLKLDYASTEYSSLNNTTPILAKFSKSAGLKPKDWTMEFQEIKNDDYNSAMPDGGSRLGDLKISDALGGEILKDVASSNPIFANAPKEALSRGTEKSFGKKFSCLDDLGGAVDPAMPSKEFGNGKLCEKLISENEKNLKNVKQHVAVCVDCKKIDTPVVSKSLIETLEVTVSKLTKEQIARGKKLVEADSKGKCVTCHSASVDMLPKDFRFIPSETDKNKAESMAIIRARKDEIAKKIENRLIKTKTMPPIENDLTDQDRQDVQAYLLSLAAGKN